MGSKPKPDTVILIAKGMVLLQIKFKPDYKDFKISNILFSDTFAWSMVDTHMEQFSEVLATSMTTFIAL